MTLNELIKEWLYESHKIEVKERTFLRYEGVYNMHISNSIGQLDINEITPRTIQRFLNSLYETISPRTHRKLTSATINIIISVLKLAYNYGIDFEITTNNPTTKIKRAKQDIPTKAQAFTRTEQIKIENYIEKSQDDEYLGIIVVLYTGLRLGEILALTWNDVNIKTGFISISKTQYKMRKPNGGWVDTVSTPKTKSSIREIPLPSFLRLLLQESKKNKKSNKVVCKNDGSKLDEKVFIKKYHTLLKQIKVRDLNFHCLRHTFATRALENRMDIKTLSEILGHANASTTLNIYTHSLMDHKKSQMRKFRRII